MVLSTRQSRGVPAASTVPARERAGGVTPRSRGFTLLEILLVLAIIGLIASVLIGGSVRLLNDKPVSPDEVFWKAVQGARKMALKSEHDVTLRFVDDTQDKTKKFVVTDGQQSLEFPLLAAGDLEVSFLGQQQGGNLIMVAGTVIDTKTLPQVTFYSDGTCTAFRVQFYRAASAHTAGVDPWTCAPMLTPADAATNPPA